MTLTEYAECKRILQINMTAVQTLIDPNASRVEIEMATYYLQEAQAAFEKLLAESTPAECGVT